MRHPKLSIIRSTIGTNSTVPKPMPEDDRPKAMARWRTNHPPMQAVTGTR